MGTNKNFKNSFWIVKFHTKLRNVLSWWSQREKSFCLKNGFSCQILPTGPRCFRRNIDTWSGVGDGLVFHLSISKLCIFPPNICILFSPSLILETRQREVLILSLSRLCYLLTLNTILCKTALQAVGQWSSWRRRCHITN